MRRFEMAACGLVAVCGVMAASATRAEEESLVPGAAFQDASVPSAAFDDDTGEPGCRVSKGLYAYYRADPEAADLDCDLVAPIQLPDRAWLGSLTCSLYDAEAANVMEAHLVRVKLATGEPASVFTTPGTVDSGSVQVLSDDTATPGARRVDNRRFAYYVAAAFSYTDFTQTGNHMRVYGCSVSYR